MQRRKTIAGKHIAIFFTRNKDGSLQASGWQNNHMAQSNFKADVLRGLQSSPKFLMSKYFYDARGDIIFQKIMRSREYYPTRAEYNILRGQADEIANALVGKTSQIDLIELGAGDAVKSMHLINRLHEKNQLAVYAPIDISENIITFLEQKFKKRKPGITVTGYTGEYFDMLPRATGYSDRRKAILFLGGNMGNFLSEQMMVVCRKLFDYMDPGDKALIGFDLKKDPRKILDAYNDKGELTAAFNLNLLKRINRELGGNFRVNQFAHYPTYDPQTGYCKSYLVSEIKQSVQIDETTINFEKGEPIFTEVSQKFDIRELKNIAQETGFIQKETFMDRKKYFADVIWEKP